MAGETLGTIRGQMILDVKEALASYTAARQAHISTVTALNTGAGAMAASGAAIAGVGAVMVGGLMAAVGAAAEFEKKMDYFNAVAGTTQDQYAAISGKALQLGADTIYSAGQVADSFIELSKSGVTAQGILDGIGEAVTNLGAATDIPLADAAAGLTTILNTFGIAATDAVGVVDQLAGAANSSSIDINDLITTITYVGASAKVAGIEFSDINAAIALLGERGIKGSKAGTGLRQMLDKLLAPTAAGTGALKDLGIVLDDGTNALIDMDGGLKPIPQMLDILNGALAGLSTAEKQDVLGKIFPITSLPTILSLLDGGSAAMGRLSTEIGKTSAMDIASQRLDNLSGDIEILRGNIDTLLVSGGGGFQTFARWVVQSITSVVQAIIDLPTWVQTSIGIVVAAFGGLLIVIGTLGLFGGALLNIIATATVLGPALLALGGALRTLAGGFITLNVAMAANPFARIIAIIGLLATAFVLLYQNNEAFRNAVQPLFDSLMNIFIALGPVITNVLDTIGGFFSMLVGQAPAAGTAAMGALGTLGQLAGTIGSTLGGALQTVLPAFMSFIGAIANFLMPVITTLMPLITALGAIFTAVFSGDFAGIAPAINSFAQAFTGVIQTISQTVIPMVIQILTSIVTALIAGLPQFIQAGVMMFTGLIQGIATVLPMIITGVLQLILAIVTAVVTALPLLVTAFVNGLTGLLTAITAMLPGLIQAFLGIVLGLITAVTTALPQVITAVVTILPQLITSILMLLPMLITAAIQLFMGLVLGLVEALPQILTALIDAGIQILLTVVGMIPMLLTTAIQLFLQIVIALVTAIPQIITALISLGPQLTMALLQALPQLLLAAIQLFVGIVTGLSEALPQIIDALIEAGPQMVQALIDAGPQFADAGVELINGLIGGFGSMGSALFEAAQNIASKAVDAIKGFFGIASPSKLFHQFGIFIMQGLVNGMTALAGDAVKTVVGIADAIANVPMALSGLDDVNSSIAVTRSMLASGTFGASAPDPALASIDKTLKELKNRPTTYQYDIVNNNPVPEKASTSIPASIRKANYVTT